MPLHNDDTNCIFNCSTIRKFQLGPFISYSFFVGISLKTAAFNLLLTHLAFSSISTRLGWQQNAKRSELLALWCEIKCRHWTHISILWIATEWPKQRHCEQSVKNAIRWHFSNQNKIWISRFNFLLFRVYLSFFFLNWKENRENSTRCSSHNSNSLDRWHLKKKKWKK